MIVIKCPKCQKEYQIYKSKLPANAKTARCKVCNHRFPLNISDVEEIVELTEIVSERDPRKQWEHSEYHPFDLELEKRQVMGFLGSVILFLGVFAPIVSIPIAGNMNYFQNGKGDGVIIIVIAIISCVLTLKRDYQKLWLPGFAALAVMAFTFVQFQIKISQLRGDLDTNLAGNPFKGIGELALQSFQIQWGWAVMIIGAILIISAGTIRIKETR